jgi:hypothetical protein
MMCLIIQISDIIHDVCEYPDVRTEFGVAFNATDIQVSCLLA